jgi:transposase
VPPVDRLNPIRAASSESTGNVLEFFRDYPDDETCLQHVWRERFASDGEHAFCSRCETIRGFKRYQTAQKRPCWFCSACGFRIHPLKGTIFERSSTSLQLWFYAMFIMSSTRCGVSAKQLERELGVTYKTAWRMFNKIRNVLMTQDDGMLSGAVEADETFIHGKPRAGDRRRAIKAGLNKYTPTHWDNKPIVFGAVERGGNVRAEVIPDSRAATVQGKVREYVLPASLIYTDDWTGYHGLKRHGYQHHRINHSARIYVEGNVHTQTIDGFFGLLKNAIRGVHHGVSAKWLQGYLNEYVWRWNRREETHRIFADMLAAATA